MKVPEIKKRLQGLTDKGKAEILRGFFKTGPGQYGEGDVFLGIKVPVLRKLAKQCRDTSVSDSVRLLKSPIHEERLLALFLLARAYAEGDDAAKKKIFGLYCRHTRYVNNWDLVDLSAPAIVGSHLLDRDRGPLYGFAKSGGLWERRIAVLATYPMIRRNEFQDTLKISEILLSDGHDLIHKAVGWMLREVGKRSLPAEEGFLKLHYRNMPRTMLRYAIEQFPEAKRKRYLNGKV